MTTFLKCLSFVTISLIYSASLHAQEDHQETDKEIIAVIKSTLQHYPVGTEFSVGKIDQSELTFCGFRKTEDSIAAVQNQDHVFEIGSISKVYTSNLLAQLVASKKLELDQSIQDFLPFPIKTDSIITIRQLANHTSGLPRMPSNFMQEDTDPLNLFLAYDDEALKQYLTNEMELMSSPGSTYAYSNLAVGLLGFIIEEINQEDFGSIFQSQLFEPLGMANTSISRHDLDAPRVEGQTALGQKTHPWDFDVLAGAGAVVSSAQDQTKFMRDQLRSDNSLVEIMTDSLFAVSEDTSVGLGWHIVRIDASGPYLWHNGATSGYCASLAIDRANETGIVILTNVSAYHPQMRKIDELTYELMKMMEE